jgi:type VI protein secretion system component VasK
MPDPLESVEADTALGKFKISGANVNNLITIISFVGVVLIAWTLYAHAGDAKESGKAIAQELKEANKAVAQELRETNKEMTAILREMARATREQNCLLSLPQDQRQKNAEVCKRISQ